MHDTIWRVIDKGGQAHHYHRGAIMGALPLWDLVIVLAHEVQRTDSGLCAVAACGEGLWPTAGECPICGLGDAIELDQHAAWCLWFWLYRRCVTGAEAQEAVAERVFWSLDKAAVVRVMRAFGDWRVERIHAIQAALGAPRLEAKRHQTEASLALTDIGTLDYLTGGAAPAALPDYRPAWLTDD